MSKAQAPTVSNETAIHIARGERDRYSRSLFDEPGEAATQCVEALSNATKLIARKKGGKDVA